MTQRGQKSLFSKLEENIHFSNSENARFVVVRDFNKLCKKWKLQISLKKKKGFSSFSPNKFINFWLYVPQRLEDKAPTR